MLVSLSHQEQSVYFEAQRRGYHVLDVPTVRTILGVSEVRSRQILSALGRKRAVQRVGRGKYALVSPTVVSSQKAPVDAYAALDELMELIGLSDSYYVAFASALKLHHMSEQVPQTILVATTKRRYERRIGAMALRFTMMGETQFFGRESMPYRDTRVWISDREKTILDCLDRPYLAGGVDEVAQALGTAWPKLDQERLLRYAERLGNAALAQRLGHLVDVLSLPEAEPGLRQGLMALRGKTAVPIDPRGEVSSAVDHLWRVKINAPLEAEALQ